MTAYLFVESNTTGTGGLAVERLLAAGKEVFFLTRSPEKYPFLESPAPGLEVVEVETNDPEGLEAMVSRLTHRFAVAAILTFSEFYVEPVARVARQCGLRFLDPEAAANCRSKHRMREVFSRAGLPSPWHRLLRSPSEAEALARIAAYPLVLKPPADSSSHGVRLVRTPGELLSHYHEVASWGCNVRGQALDRTVLAEEFLDGPEFSVETFTVPGRGTSLVGVVDKHLSEPPLFVELGHDFPSRADAERQRLLVETTFAALEEVGFDFGPAHTELRWTSRGPVVVEINPRLAGGMIPELVRYARGVDLIGEWLALLAGRDVDLAPRHEGFASIRFLVAPVAGCIEAVEGVEEARRLPGIRSVEIKGRPGDPITPAVDAYGRLGSVIAAGHDPWEVRRAVERGLGAVHLRIGPGPAVVSREEQAV